MARSFAGLLSRCALAVACALVAVPASPASAEIVVLANGRTVFVRGHRFDGDRVVLHLRSGGVVVCPAATIDRILPDEVPDLSVPTPDRSGGLVDDRALDDLIEAAAAAHGVDPRLVRAIVQVESAFRPDARSPKGAMGLMQLMPGTAEQYAVGDPYEPAANLDAGVRHLRRLLERYDVPLALAAYNAGEAAVERYRGIPPYRETVAYVRQVVRLLERALAEEPASR